MWLIRNPQEKLAVAALVVLLATVSAAASKGDQIGSPIFAVKNTDAATKHGVITIPTWTNEFSYKAVDNKSKTYSYTMVGTSPWAGSAITTIATEIIPLALIFSNGRSLDAGAKIGNTVSSPIFQSFPSPVGKTQFGDSVLRASFYSVVREKSPGWHVLLGTPEILPIQTITVPAEVGFEFTGASSGASVGLVNMIWFQKRLEALIKSLNLDPTSLPIFLTYNSFLFAESPEKCCVIGFHSAVLSPGPGNAENVNTYIWASYSDPRIFAAPIEDITALSHEVAEWYSDPLVENVVPAWVQPNSGVCFSNLLEGGDAIQSDPRLSFPVFLNGIEYHPQDVALFSWFARQAPSIGLGGRYSYRGDKLRGPAQSCPKR